VTQPVYDFSERVVVVTGGSRGVGAGIVAAFAAAGAHVVACGRNEAQIEGAVFVTADIRKPPDAERVIAKAVEHFGRLDILINNAGTTAVIPHSDLEAATTDVWRRIFGVNVFGTWQLTVAAVPHLRASGDGVVVNVSSLAGHRPVGSSIPYAASKAALSHMTILLANVLGPAIRVNAVAPGLVDTPWTADWDLVRSFVQAQAPLGRSGRPEDIAEVVLSLVTASYVTGEVVLVDGGLHLR
jgi:ketoreductase RED2